MTQVTRYFHIRPVRNKHDVPGGHKGGATVKVTGDAEKVGYVTIQSAFCSRRDPFCRKTGRAEADKAPEKTVLLRHLPAELDNVGIEMHRKVKPAIGRAFDFTFAIKYFLPKD